MENRIYSYTRDTVDLEASARLDATLPEPKEDVLTDGGMRLQDTVIGFRQAVIPGLAHVQGDDLLDQPAIEAPGQPVGQTGHASSGPAEQVLRHDPDTMPCRQINILS